ncbi:DNA mismatch repair protein MutS [Sporolactobacillus terrae]|uniref:DNA mismatch repair protein MutS n=1 Tax=Sporolactobacillus terrae TaxID=269673 RepID=A0A410D8K4_9BACL|nr:DNA mismatch repair protein MutS [Sporolactobacillus terrae]QAA22414.1 DNA mismatch repair protein MutS [Sporolactobacillus terrae]QAA25389.1 DNA mismatch repair protein MutS [Sporolactobacillus terrae]UAK17198.1 DNA mismatch repair protein MutS [Sporolactobacillus terrae]BBN98732.1 DNA mismatch repair protein MutS [Sporolactobacillus terrae]
MSYTPMIQQYLAIKAQYQDAFLFFRLGDFYELFFDDAKKASKELEIALTSRNGGKDEYIPMCGVPYHAAKQYIKVLIDKGYKIAICEQMEDPKLAKGMVRREVIQMITPGTIMEDESLQPKKNNYLAALTAAKDGSFGLALSDLTTGEIRVTLISGWDGVIQELDANDVRELILASNFDPDKKEEMVERLNMTFSESDASQVPDPLQKIAVGIDQKKLIDPLGKLLSYLVNTQKRSLDHLQRAEVYQINAYMMIDQHSRRNLELTQTNREKKTYGSLLWLLDDVKTAMGGRRLKQWIEKPLLSKSKIEKRLDAVAALKERLLERETLRSLLGNVYDLERLVGRVSFGNVNPREVVQLKRSLEQIPEIKRILAELDETALAQYEQEMDPCTEVRELITDAIVDDPPFTTSDGGMIKPGYHETLDQYRDASKNGKRWIAELEAKERETTGIKSLKIGYNRVFGYYIEVSKPNLKLIPEGRYERRQTLSNAERFITPELKEKERVILEAEEKRVGLEFQIFGDVRLKIKEQSERLQKLARLVSSLDVLQSFASVSDQNGYVRPQFSNKRALEIKNSRHPVIERVMRRGTFVANDIRMDETCDLLMITGPNMGGKSTYMRQAALTAIMAQVGCFVPADHAELPIFDQIFTRIGAADDLVSGQSTFMVEMDEANYALSHATQNSLILLDEIGRGTSTYDGIAIAQAIVEFIHDHIAAKTFFSTHYHELTFLEEKLERLKNIHVGAMEENGTVVFLHKVLEGQADKSYGIHVAKLAGLPDALIERADTILQGLEGNAAADSVTDDGNQSDLRGEAAAAQEVEEEPQQLALFTEPKEQEQPPRSKQERRVLQELDKIELLSMTPMDAMNKLFQLQKTLKK